MENRDVKKKKRWKKKMQEHRHAGSGMSAVRGLERRHAGQNARERKIKKIYINRKKNSRTEHYSWSDGSFKIDGQRHYGKNPLQTGTFQKRCWQMIVRSVSRVHCRRNPEIHQSNGLPITWDMTTNCVEILFLTDSILHLVVSMDLLKTSVFSHWKKLPFRFYRF